MSSNRSAWQKLGEAAPYHSVLVADEYRPENLTADHRDRFFDSGRKHVADLMALVHELRPGFTPRTAVDFGCGVGRLAIPLARMSAQVLAVDVSEAMLEEARRNCREAGVGNVRFLQTDELARLEPGSANLVHSFIVLQHIAPREGYPLIERLIGLLEEGGIGALHVTFHDDRPFPARLLSWIKNHVPGAAVVQNLLRGRPPGEAVMQMHTYRLDRLFRQLHDRGCHAVTARFTQHGVYRGVLLVFEKVARPSW